MKLAIQLYLFVFLFSACHVNRALEDKKVFEKLQVQRPQVVVLNAHTTHIQGNKLLHNKQQLWELYVTGSPLAIGFKLGALTDSLYAYQEHAFFEKVEELIPSRFRQKTLIKLAKYYNRHIQDHIPLEYRKEIYGLSTYANPRYNYLIDPYQRNLALHGAHDLGHAFQDLAVVGCTSLAAWGDQSEDGQLIIGRNFDFYVGDDFAKNKIVALIKPDSGYAFLSVTWAGMIGVVSGMNTEGLTVTLNAAKSSIPWQAKTPISIVAREILQYASNFEEAIAIAKTKEVFVSESLMIGSAHDGKAMLLEISLKAFAVYEAPNQNYLICSNHFQSDTYAHDKRNQEQIRSSHSAYRFEKMQEQVHVQQQLNPTKMAAILRDRNGLKNKDIGLGNEKALNQLMAHHGIIFKPNEKIVWVSANPYQLGEFVAYDLNKIFGATPQPIANSLATTSLNIKEDPFLKSTLYIDYIKYKMLDEKIETKLKQKAPITDEEWDQFQKLNPKMWSVYAKRGTYYFNQKKYQEARAQFEYAQSLEVTTLADREVIAKYLKKIKRKTA